MEKANRRRGGSIILRIRIHIRVLALTTLMPQNNPFNRGKISLTFIVNLDGFYVVYSRLDTGVRRHALSNIERKLYP